MLWYYVTILEIDAEYSAQEQAEVKSSHSISFGEMMQLLSYQTLIALSILLNVSSNVVPKLSGRINVGRGLIQGEDFTCKTMPLSAWNDGRPLRSNCSKSLHSMTSFSSSTSLSEIWNLIKIWRSCNEIVNDRREIWLNSELSLEIVGVVYFLFYFLMELSSKHKSIVLPFHRRLNILSKVEWYLREAS